MSNQQPLQYIYKIGFPKSFKIDQNFQKIKVDLTIELINQQISVIKVINGIQYDVTADPRTQDLYNINCFYGDNDIPNKYFLLSQLQLFKLKYMEYGIYFYEA